MIHDKGVLMFLWKEACSTTVYVHNRCPHRRLRDTTLEDFTDERPDIGHLRIFGCHVYVHVPWKRRTKLDPSGNKVIIIGYNDFAKPYRIYILGQRKIELSGDVTFEEDISYHRSRHAESGNDE